MAIDPQRRRLTVGNVGPVTRGGSGATDPEPVPLKEVFAKLGQAYCSVNSTTDTQAAKKKSFANKDEQNETNLPGSESWLKNCAWACKKGMKPESPNQDSFSVTGIGDKSGPKMILYGVYDGHGPKGHDISELVRKKLVELFLTHPNRDSDTGKAFTEAFLATQMYVEANKKYDSSTSGTTCTMVYHDLQKNTLTVAHVADSRCILGWKKGSQWECEDLTIDHKPDLPKEKKRIESSKPPGRVVFDGFYNHRVFAQNGMYPGLNMSRALGDVIAHKEAGISGEPDIRVVEIDKVKSEKGVKELKLLLCTDGVWEFIPSEEAWVIADKGSDSKQCVEKLSKESYDRWMKDSDNEISDDITAIMVNL